MATSEKTITCVPFLNKRLKPIIFDDGSKGYPLYIRVIYESKNTHIPIDYEDWGYDKYTFYYSEDDFDSFIYELENLDELLADINEGVSAITWEIREFMEFLQKVVEYETRLKPNRYSLRGLGKRLKLFNEAALESQSKQLVSEIKDYLDNWEDGSFGYLIRPDHTFLQNFYRIEDYSYSYGIRFPEKIVFEIEYYFLVAAFANHEYGPSYRYLQMDSGLASFKRFMNQDSLFDPEVLLKVELKNRFSRFLSLNPPTFHKDLYYNKLEQFLKSMKDKHQKMIG
jgi:hypothetical protein